MLLNFVGSNIIYKKLYNRLIISVLDLEIIL